VSLELEVCPDAETAVERVASLIAERARATEDRFSLALSGGSIAADLSRALGEQEIPWERVDVYQVDERVAPPGHPDRNLTGLISELPAGARRDLHAMPVENDDLEAAADDYAAQLPPALDLVHLGLGTDGHTASLVPGDAVLDVRDRRVAVTDEYEGRRRMTLTYPALDAAREIVWLVTGESKRDALAKLLARDESIPSSRVAAESQVVVADASAAEAVGSR
jgi:6-phosphogluconolactonase